MAQRVAINGIDRGEVGQPALGISADTAFGALTLTDMDGRFTGNPINHNAVHVGIDKSKTVVAGDQCELFSVPFTYAGQSARIKVVGRVSDEACGYQIVSERDGSVLLNFDPKTFDFGFVTIQA
jgi:hypothetical protein